MKNRKLLIVSRAHKNSIGRYQSSIGYSLYQSKISTIVCNVFGNTKEECTERTKFFLTAINNKFNK